MKLVRSRFATDANGCPTCHLELVPALGRWICPECKFERATMHPPRIVATKPEQEKEMETVTEIQIETNHQAPALELVSLKELGERWGISEQGAKFRVDKKGIEIIRNDDRHRAVRAADVDGADFTPQRPGPVGERKPKAPSLPAPIVEPAPIARPLAHYEAVQVGDSERVIRLVKALRAIREILTDTDSAPSFAAWAVADYAIAAETTDGS